MNFILIRFFDILLSFLLITIALPLMLLVGLAIFIEDRGTPLFFQNRVGRGGKLFRIVKFRSMYIHDDVTTSAAKNSFEDLKKLRSSFTGTLPNDKRITKVGKLIRKTSIDEIPQLFNVLLGDMSLVGVRPDTPVQIVDYDESFWNKRNTYKPGITGLAQINGRSSISMDDRNRFDNNWIDNYSFKLYLQTLINTFLYFFKGKLNSN